MTTRGAPTRPRLAVVTPDATPEEVAAIVAAVGLVLAGRPPAGAADGDALDEWVRAARLRARRAAMQRGPWRLSARVARRARV